MKLLLFIGVLTVLWYQVQRIDSDAWLSFGLSNPFALFTAIILVVPNIGLAFKKWVMILGVIGISTDSRTKSHSFFAGIVTGFLTPNMLGNFIGRFYYFEKQYRLSITALTMLSNFGQFLASITFGTLAVFWMGELIVWHNVNQLMYVLLFIVLLSYLAYFYVDNVVRLFRRIDFGIVFQKYFKKQPWFRAQILLLSIGRFLIFTAQFTLMLIAFGAPWSWELVAAIWQVYLLTMIAPSLFLGKIGVKESIALFVLSAIGLNQVSVLFASLSIWLLNTAIPPLFGLFICRNRTFES